MISDHSRLKHEIIERIKSMVFLCMYCNNSNPITVSVVDYEYQNSGSHATAFFICPDCHNKFIVKIQDVGKVR
jgi:5-methylcytosine-specific restriction endonuclease McrA